MSCKTAENVSTTSAARAQLIRWWEQEEQKQAHERGIILGDRVRSVGATKPRESEVITELSNQYWTNHGVWMWGMWGSESSKTLSKEFSTKQSCQHLQKQNKSIIIYTDCDCVCAVCVLADMAFRCTEQQMKHSDLVSLHPGPCEQTAESSSKHTRPWSDPHRHLAPPRERGIVSPLRKQELQLVLGAGVEGWSLKSPMQPEVRHIHHCMLKMKAQAGRVQKKGNAFIMTLVPIWGGG